MLWTDGYFLSTDDLKRVDSEVVDVANAEQITLGGNYGSIRGAIEETTNELMKLMVSYGGSLFASSGVSQSHIAAVNYTGMTSRIRFKALPAQVVVSGVDEYNSNNAKLWAVHWALYFIYRDAYNRTVKDRYESKMRYFKTELQRRLTPSLYLGIPIILNPLARPGALFEREVGTWSDANATTHFQTGCVGGTFDVAITFVDMTDSTRYVDATDKNNCESHPSDRATVVVSADYAITVDISTLSPRSTQHPATQMLATITPRSATHWNVYVGSTGGTLYLQNGSPIAIGTTAYVMAADPTLSGYTPGVGQYADRYLAITPSRQRA